MPDEDEPAQADQAQAPAEQPQPRPIEKDPAEGFGTEWSIRSRRPEDGFKTKSRIFEEPPPDRNFERDK
jgi:hypothetical protein